MSRITPLSPPYDKELQTRFDKIMPEGIPPLLLFRTLGTSKRAWNKFLGGSLLDRGPLPLRHREIAIIRTCARTKCEYEWGVHIQLFAKIADFTGEQITEITGDGRLSSIWSANEKSLIETVDALHESATLTDEEYKALSIHFTNDEILEIFLLAGFYRTVSYLCNGLDLPLETGAARFPQ